MSEIHTRKLGCGATLVCEPMSGVRSVGLAWLLPAGTARDPGDRVGLSAMHAELVLRGDQHLDARAQADAFDRLGASRSAKVETQATVVRGTMLGTRLAEALPRFADMVLRPRMAPESIEPTRALCISAIEALADEPQDRVMVNLRAAHAPAPLNRAAQGTLEGVRAVAAEEALPRWRERATPGGSIIALAGDVDPDDAQDRLERLLDGWEGAAPEIDVEPQPPRGYVHEQDRTDQIHIAVAYDGPPEPDEERAWLERMATAVLSGGMSGRLFTEVRERRSLCYAVWASFGADRTYARTVAYAGTTPDRAQETLDVLMHELRRIGTPDGRITEDELERARIGMKSRLVFSGESSSARASALAGDMRKLGRARTLDEMARRIDEVTLDGLNAYLADRDLGRMTVATLGPRELRWEPGL